MKRWQVLGVAGTLMLLGACATHPGSEARTDMAGGAQVQVETGANDAQSEESTDRVIIRDASGTVEVQKVPFQIGVSSVTVERMARKAGCETQTGAGLVTTEGPVEVYRVQCEDGTRYLAQCVLRQCSAMRK